LGRQTTISNRVTTEYAYNTKSQITKIEHKDSNGNIFQSFAYTLDNIGNRLKIVQENNRTVTYSYNSVNQLTIEKVTNDPNGHNTTTEYSYDAVGNLVSKSVDGVEISYTYNANDQLTDQDGESFNYDDNGNLITQGDTTYSYNAQNQLIRVTTPTSTIEYSYDANNNRITKSINNQTTHYLVDNNTRYAQVINESNATDTISYTYGNDLINHTTNSSTYYYHTDALGSTRSLTNSSSTLEESYNYTPYGKLLDSNATKTKFLYTGEFFDSESDNYYLRARYYNPNTTRFISRDSYDGTANNPITLNHYAYGNSNPTMFVDPSGKWSIAQVTLGVVTAGYFGSVILPKMAGRHTINSGLFQIFISGGIGQFYVPAIGKYVDQAIQHDPSLAVELDRERAKEAESVERIRNNRRILYHYTDKNSAALIAVDKAMYVTPKHSSGAPRGVYATDIEPWNVSYTQKEISQLFYGGSVHRDVSWYVALDGVAFIHRPGTREYYIGSPLDKVPVDVITIGKNLMLPDRIE